MSALDRFAKAKENLRRIKVFLDKIGAKQNTTVRDAYGHVHSITTSTTIYFQPYDGATNYHESSEFDLAFQAVVKKHWKELSAEALANAVAEVEAVKAEAAKEYEDQFGKIIAA